jgi:hypothetical protein
MGTPFIRTCYERDQNEKVYDCCIFQDCDPALDHGRLLAAARRDKIQCRVRRASPVAHREFGFHVTVKNHHHDMLEAPGNQFQLGLVPKDFRVTTLDDCIPLPCGIVPIRAVDVVMESPALPAHHRTSDYQIADQRDVSEFHQVRSQSVVPIVSLDLLS